METSSLAPCLLNTTYRSYPTYEEWKQTPSSIQTFSALASSYPTYEEWKPSGFGILSTRIALVLILPMRNGNFSSPSLELQAQSSYPTYEEWKRMHFIKKWIDIGSSYPTYEEWKQT